MNHLFILSSAIHTKFGMYDTDQRVLQTHKTINSIKQRVPNARIVIIESGGYAIPKDVLANLIDQVTLIVDMSSHPNVQAIHDSTPNWDLVKNVCEVMCFNLAFPTLEQHKVFDGVDRIHKISGRYELNDHFDPAIYEKYTNKIIFSPKMNNMYDKGMKIPYMYISRLWSWPKCHHQLVKDFYQKAIIEMKKRTQKNWYVDIEHLLYKFLPQKHIHEVPLIGIQGNLAANRDFVSN